jgi:hypothetical protein
MDEDIRKILERPFSDALLKQRQGPGNKQFTYIEVQHYIDRLNEAFGGAWSWEVTRREQVDDQLIVEGRLTAGSVVKSGLGGAVVTRRRDDGQMVGLADDFKKGEADAIKRASRLLGIGGHLYTDDVEDSFDATPASRPAPSPAQARTTAAPSPARTTTSQRPTTAAPPERNRLSAKQLAAIWNIARDRGYDDPTFRGKVTQRFGVQPEHLTRTQASELIGVLTSNGNGHDRAPAQER